MTNENNDIETRVSDAYRDLASETAPPELDRKVLSMAAGARRSRYGKARTWIRPAAWAATIGLSLAFVLELSQVPENAPLSTGGSDADTFEILDESAVGGEPPARTKSDAAVRQERETRLDSSAASSPGAPSAAAEPAADRDSAAADFEADDMRLLEEAEERARMQSGQARPAARAAEFSAVAEKKEQASGCDADARTSAQTWYACIEALRESGLPDAAAAEFEALRAEFPDFEEPTPNR